MSRVNFLTLHSKPLPYSPPPVGHCGLAVDQAAFVPQMSLRDSGKLNGAIQCAPLPPADRPNPLSWLGRLVEELGAPA